VDKLGVGAVCRVCGCGAGELTTLHGSIDNPLLINDDDVCDSDMIDYGK
jgi:hypothetical protein